MLPDTTTTVTESALVDSDKIYNSTNLDYDVIFVIEPEERPLDAVTEERIEEVGMDLYEAMDVFLNNPNYTSYDVNKIFEEQLMNSNNVQPIELPYPVQVEIEYTPLIGASIVFASFMVNADEIKEEDYYFWNEGGEYFGESGGYEDYYELAKDLQAAIKSIEAETDGKLKYIKTNPGEAPDIPPFVNASIEDFEYEEQIYWCSEYPNLRFELMDWIGTPDEIIKALNGDKNMISRVEEKGKNWKEYL